MMAAPPPLLGESPAFHAALAHVSPDDAARDTMVKLASTYPPEDIVKRLDSMLEATETYTTAKGASYTRPSWGPRAKGLELLLAYIIGRPIERQQVIKTTAPLSLEDLVEQAKASPVFLESLIGLLNRIKEEKTS